MYSEEPSRTEVWEKRFLIILNSILCDRELTLIAFSLMVIVQSSRAYLRRKEMEISSSLLSDTGLFKINCGNGLAIHVYQDWEIDGDGFRWLLTSGY